MFDALLKGCMISLSWPVVVYLFIGASIGSIIGFIPGLGGLFALSILLPFAYPMDMYSGIAFLLAAHAVINTTGSITSILFAVPGAAGTAATIFDGYPLTQKGQAGRALGANIAASALGGIFGAVVLTVMIPVIRPIVLSMRSPEFFMLTIFGIAMISTLSTGSTLKAWIMGLAGLLLSTVGLENSHGIPRFTFGMIYLWDGIKIVPAVIGLFAIAEMIDLTARGAPVISEKVQKIDNFLEGFKDVLRHWTLVLRCGALGCLLGAVPGLAGDSINFIAYGHAKQTSRCPEEFGKGAIEGVIGPESANNSKEGGILLPTLALGIPGAASMAILLSTFEVWGVVTGPSMLKQNLPLVFVMVFALVWGNIIGAAFCFPLSMYASRLTNVRNSFMVPGILVLSTIGAFASANNMGDIIMAIVFGILGFIFKRLRFQRAVFLIGLVLGDIAEGYLNLSMRIYEYRFLLRPITILIMLLVAAVVLLPFYQARRKRRRGDDGAEKSPPFSAAVPEKIFAVGVFAFFVVFFALATQIPSGAKRVPLLMSGAGLVLSGAALFQILLTSRAGTGRTEAAKGHASISNFISRPEVLLVFWLSVFTAMIYLVGLLLAITIFLFLMVSFFFKERVALGIAASAAGVLFYYSLFIRVLGVQTFRGILFNFF